ncbi:MAG: hypothetical protein HYY78_03685 [Betaproteobacteria bacterium]|nr:hypothetical protein [Betaproteobacteria bacterium]
MSSQSIVLAYIQSCTSGKLALSDCGPIWQMLVIVTFLLIAIAALVVLRLRVPSQDAKA